MSISPTAKNIFKVYFGDIFSKVLAAGSLLIIIRGLSKSDYAAYTAFYVVLYLFPGLTGNGINMAIVRYSAEYISKNKDQPLDLYLWGMILQVAIYIPLCTVLLLNSELVRMILFGEKSFGLSLTLGLAGGLGLLLTQACRGIYQGQEKFQFYIRTLWFRQAALFTVVSSLFFLERLDFRNLGFSIVIVELLVGIIISLHASRFVRTGVIGSVLSQRTGILREFFSSSAWLILYFLVLTTFQRLDVFMLSHFSTETEISSYGVAFRYYSLCLLLLGSIHAVLLPKFSRHDMQDADRQRLFAIRWLRMTIWLVIPVVIFCSMGKPLFVYINGRQYEDAFEIFSVFLFAVWLSLMFSPLVNVLIGRKEFKLLVLLAAGGLVTNFTGNYLVIPRHGGLGAAAVTLLSNNILIQGFIFYFVVLRRYK